MKKTKTGNYSTNMKELIKLEDQHPIIKEIINYREISKLVSTYIDALPKLVDKENRLHTTFDQAGTATGRLSSKDPNIQNIPKRTELGMDIRKAFVVEKGFDLVAFDYSQIELRVTAILSGDPKLKEIFKKGEDVHSAVSSEVFNVPLDKVTSDMRRKAKVINFGIIYGMGVNSLSKNLGCSKEEAQKFHDEYFDDFKGVKQFLDKTLDNAYNIELENTGNFSVMINSQLTGIFVLSAGEKLILKFDVWAPLTDVWALTWSGPDSQIKYYYSYVIKNC